MRDIYINLAMNSLRKNSNFYVPYVISSAIMVALYLTLSQLSVDQVIGSIHGARTLRIILGVGLPVIVLLSALFITYMSSFIMKRRRKELGLYSVLGMEKRHVIRVVFIENIIVSTVSIMSGTVFGILFEKVAQLLLLKIVKMNADFSFKIEVSSIVQTVGIFAAIFLFILLNSIREILFKSLLSYIKDEQTGEKKPKARWLLGTVGLVVLGFAYYMAMTVSNGGTAINRFVQAVFLVIIATYILFIVGSIAVLTLMKKNKKYYYKTNNFISVSGMIYRMKRNGAGLASICILSTMVLVMLSSVSTVFFYNGKAFSDRFIYDFGMSVDDEKKVESEDGNTVRISYDQQEIVDQIYECAKEVNVEITDLVKYKTINHYSTITDNKINLDVDYSASYYEVWVINNSDYNSINNENITLNDNQIGWFFMNGKHEFTGDLDIEKIGVFENIKLPSRPRIMPGEYTSTSTDILFLVTPNSISTADYGNLIWNDDVYISAPTTYYGFNVSGSEEDELNFFNKYSQIYLEELSDEELIENNTNAGNYDGVYRHIFSSYLFRQLFYNMYGGLLFLGILLSIACIVIAVLIMYFKQILEGYEDAKRFSIMKKVGLTTDEIKKSIYSQIVMVFITPLLVAGIHTAFAYKMVKSLIILFGISEIDGYFGILAICMVVFMLFYGLVFWITSGKYFKIVNAAENAV